LKKGDALSIFNRPSKKTAGLHQAGSFLMLLPDAEKA
jgi:hypothetical protein